MTWSSAKVKYSGRCQYISKFANFLATPNARLWGTWIARSSSPSVQRRRAICPSFSFLFSQGRFPVDADILYDALKRVNIDFLVTGDRVAQFLTENLKAKVAVLNSVLNKDDAKTTLCTRDEHPEWFADLETNYATKVSREGIIVCLVTLLTIRSCFHGLTKWRTGMSSGVKLTSFQLQFRFLILFFEYLSRTSYFPLIIRKIS